jgi:hypothetical protein
MAQQPPAPPPPPPPPTGPYGGAPGYGVRPGGVTTSAILLFVVGGLRVLIFLISLIAVIGAGDELAGIAGAGTFIGIAVVVVLIAIAAGILQIIGGANTLGLRRRGRVLGLTGTIIGMALGVLGLIGGSTGGSGSSVVFAVLFLIGDIAIIVLLAQNGRYLTNP